MATRFYLPTSGTPPLAALGVHASWEVTGDVTRLPMSTAKTATALTTRTLAWAGTSATRDWLWWQYQSPPIRKPVLLTPAHTGRLIVGLCGETTTGGNTGIAGIIRLVSEDGNTEFAVLNTSLQNGGAEFPLIASAATATQGPDVLLGSTLAPMGSRIILELGVRGLNPALENIQMRNGDPLAVDDFAFTGGLTTDLVPWFELSADIDFGAAEYDFHWVNDATGALLNLQPIQSTAVSLTVANGQLIPIKSRQLGSTAIAVGLLP